MTYVIKACDAGEQVNTSFNMSVSETVKIHQVQNYVCCANMTLSMDAEGRVIRIYEENVGEMCKCICPFEADIEIKNAQGYGRIEVYGIKFRDVQDYEFLFNATLP